MFVVERKKFLRSIVLIIVVVSILLLATTAFAQEGKPSGPGPNPMGAPGGPMKPMGGPEMGGKMMCSVITGMVWYDGNGNMELDPHKTNPYKGEHPMDGAIVKLWALPMPKMGPAMGGPMMGPPKDGPMMPGGPMMHGYYPEPAKFVFAQTTAHDGGYYKFECVPPGLYSIEVIAPPNHVMDKISLKHNPTHPFELMPGESKHISFGWKVDLPFKNYGTLNS